MRIKPLHDQLVVKPIENGAYSSGGLLIPSIARNNSPYRYGDVVEVGSGRVNSEGKKVGCVCKKGDVVAYARNSGVEFPIYDDDGVEEVVLLISEKYVLGRVEGLKRNSSLMGIDGKLMMMMPQSMAKADSSYKNIEDLSRQAKDWPEFGDSSDHVDEG